MFVQSLLALSVEEVFNLSKRPIRSADMSVDESSRKSSSSVSNLEIIDDLGSVDSNPNHEDDTAFSEEKLESTKAKTDDDTADESEPEQTHENEPDEKTKIELEEEELEKRDEESGQVQDIDVSETVDKPDEEEAVAESEGIPLQEFKLLL